MHEPIVLTSPWTGLRINFIATSALNISPAPTGLMAQRVFLAGASGRLPPPGAQDQACMAQFLRSK